MLEPEIDIDTTDKHDSVTFVVEGQRLICKKSCLVKYDYFKKLLEGSFKEAKQSEIEIHDVTFAAFKQIMDFIVTFNVKDFRTAKDFGIKIVTPKELLLLMGELP